jgi:anti-anti-sigma factor
MQGSFSIEEDGDCLKMSGELDDRSALATSETVRRFVGIDLTTPVHLDLTNVTFIDSVGLRELVRLRQRLPMLRIVAVNSRLRRVFDITGTTELLLDGLGSTPA